jgi:hypothetical protein
MEEQITKSNDGQSAASNVNPPANPPTTPPGGLDTSTNILAWGCASIILACLILFIIALIIGACQGGSSDNPNNPFDARVMAEQFVKNSLKCPSSAHFGRDGDFNANITMRDDGAYEVKGWVDAQNSFGAMVRTHYVVMVKYVGTDTWELVGAPLLVQ